jgi:hypothetical protein
MQSNPQSRTLQARLVGLIRQPRVMLFLLAGWSLLAGVTQLFVNSSVFLDIHEVELDGALGGLALSFNAVPLALLYMYCARDPLRYDHVFWLALVHQGAMASGNLYHLAIGTFSAESTAIPLAGAVLLAVLSFLQVFEPRARAKAPVHA